MGHATPAEHQAVPTAERAAVPAWLAVQIASTPWGGGDGAGSGASRPGGSTVTFVH